ncbi:MAG TPA: hypothetical protein DDW51_02955 [Cyanobacteria bacterium UBA11367]|nr:hypothetical protein [Cyanobacteria bacterium UBA11367]
MAKQLVRFDLEGGSGFILVEVVEPESQEYGEQDTSVGDYVAKQATKTFESALKGCLNPVAEAVIADIKNLSKLPSEVEVKFALKMGAGVTVVAAGNAEANYEVTLKWNQKDL